MKMSQVYDFYRAAEDMFCCPVCHRKMHLVPPAAIVCQGGHCFDIARDGYIHFLPNQRVTKYRNELFESRSKIFAEGFYTPLAEALCGMVEAVQKGRKFCVADAGCGEGYYDAFLQINLEKVEIVALDNVKEAVRMGAKREKSIRWLVANLAAIPLVAGRMDLLLQIFAPANYAEFRRVVKKDGYVLKVVPGNRYLKELRDCIQKNGPKAYDSALVEAYFRKHVRLVERNCLIYQREVDSDTMHYFLKMTPLMFGKSAADVPMSELKSLTFDFVFLLGKV